MKAGNCYYSRRGGVHNVIHIIEVGNDYVYVEIISVYNKEISKNTHKYFGNMIYVMYPELRLIPNSILKYFEVYQRKLEQASKEFINKIIKLDN
jgi:hypothetical protein